MIDLPAERPIGRTGVRVSALGFGAAPIGNLYRPVSEQQAQAAIAEALRSGVSYFDTAPYYGLGLSELRLGSALRSAGVPVTLSTKVGRLLRRTGDTPARTERYGFADVPNFEIEFDYGYDGVMRSFESSLERLGVEYVDILLAHDLGYDEHGERHTQRLRQFVDGGYRAMRELQAAGRVGAIGTGTREWQVCDELLDEVDLDCLLLAGRCTLLDQSIPADFFARCQQRGTAIVLAGVFNSGILVTGTMGSDMPRYEYAPAPPDIIDRVARIETVCADFGVDLPAVALQFAVRQPQVSSVLVGWADPAQVRASLDWLAQDVPDALWEALQAQGLLPAGQAGEVLLS